MLPLERQNRIKQLILENKSMKISDLSTLLNVSEMTIHRDLKPLIEDGTVIKTFGGITIPEIRVPDSKQDLNNDKGKCVLCGRIVNERMAYRLILSTSQIETACCAHCGLLRYQQLNDRVIHAICPDFLKQTTISAPVAWYVMDTEIHMGCCHPQILTFELKEHADKFVNGFGGYVFNFYEAKNEIIQKLQGHNSSCKRSQQ
ncbi:DeoR family transcriptional regulator [Oceanobacillus sp. FSL K6-2867]|uniref:DeoR family transcriptional regulator n=1 Tax=Oceanobacillus sp. FSL K6-2867 TaxID=2954748 RepID=UPI0030DD0166